MDRLAPLVESFLTSAEELKAKIDVLERVIERQGLDKMAPGTVVDKPFCDIEHDELKQSVCGRATNLEKGTNRKIYSTWVVLFALLSWFGLAIRSNSQVIQDLFKEVFK